MNREELLEQLRDLIDDYVDGEVGGLEDALEQAQEAIEALEERNADLEDQLESALNDDDGGFADDELNELDDLDDDDGEGGFAPGGGDGVSETFGVVVSEAEAFDLAKLVVQLCADDEDRLEQLLYQLEEEGAKDMALVRALAHDLMP